MKAHLMYRDADFVLKKVRPWQADLLARDLELATLCATMGGDDEFLQNVARAALSDPLDDADKIRYRQQVLTDCLANPEAVRMIYDVSVEAIVLQKKSYFGFYSRYPAAMLSSARELMECFVTVLRKLRHIADTHVGAFESAGFAAFFDMIRRELSDDYFDVLALHLKTLKFKHGVLVSASIGAGNRGEGYVLRKPHDPRTNLVMRMFAKRPESYGFSIPERDEAGARALSELESRGIDLVANAVSQSAEHVLSFFDLLRTELGFYIGCINLRDAMSSRGYAMCMPDACESASRRLDARDLFEICLALRLPQRVVPNDVSADGCDLVMITGANEGGKSTFLRSIAIAQLMMQVGMRVPASRFASSVSSGLFTHYKREEDASMKSGKFDEELVRISEIVDHVSEGAMVFFNESFASTNEREGAEVATAIVRALLGKAIRVFFVTHMYALSHALYESRQAGSLFMRAERSEDGERTHRLVEGEPLETSYGEDLYRRVFEAEAHESGTANAPRERTEHSAA
jgi:DNA mismatch repair ATPase MutS